MKLARNFQIRDEAGLSLLIAFVRSVDYQIPLDAKVTEYKDSRSLPQNATMWMWLTDISQQAWPDGQQFDPETWNEYMKREFLPEENSKGKKKWRYLPDGDRVLNMSTSDLDTEEMGLYMQKMDVWAAENGIMLRIPGEVDG